MNAAHLHLMVNHLPVIGTVIVLPILLAAFLSRNPTLTRTGLWMLIGIAVAAVAVYFTGEPAEEVVERLPGVTDALIERHEEAALVATVLLGVAAGVALSALYVLRTRGSPIQSRVTLAMLVVSLVPTVAMGYVAWAGGHIRHTEVRSGAVTAPSLGDAPAPSGP